ncbi:gluconokinase [Acetilactobacillus jinshanensis]|uniref:Gluconokinase n=1 Tax=Acetilactobacillus jinshanensis TaxID=1720083 RepID=A0A4P6ZJR3_9LACO|nr:gluconokinase [Acetilactobacillus jinshanensis]QBP17864.1 gluconokinase [Acetilactobacillus jinshanensis]URL60726.1 gluconokinase [uncultured bacterium]
MDYVIGADIGTTSIKLVLYNTKGKVLGYVNNGYKLYQDAPGMAEEDPHEIYLAMLKGLHDLTSKVDNPSDIKGVSFSCAMHSLILLDKNHRPLTRALTWADNRAYKYADQLKHSDLGPKLYQATGTPIHPMTPLTKIMWFRNERPDLFKKAHWFVGLKEYIIYLLFGTLKEDYSIANATGMFNIHTMDWDPTALKVAGVKRDQLPELVDTTYQLKGLNSHVVKLTGLDPKMPFVIGASDGPLANLGVNAIQPGVLAITIGTSGAVRVITDKPKTDPKGRVFCYYLYHHMWVVGGPVNNGGIVFRWIRDQICGSEKVTAKELNMDPYDLLTKIASTVPAGSDGVICHPFLGGERAPIWDANARASFFGLTRQDGIPQMIRAALEGIVYNLFAVNKALEDVVGKPKSIQATGGFARSGLWRQMLADIFDQEVTIPKSFEGTALGAATLGMLSLGLIDNLGEVKNFVGTTRSLEPIKKNADVYKELIPIYLRLGKKLETEYKAIADFQREHHEG